MDFSQILMNYKYTSELHAHSYPASDCADFSPAEVVEFYKAKGVTSLVLSNHLTNNHYLGDESPKERAKKYLEDYRIAKDAAGSALNVILSAEVRFDGTHNDYLVYGIEEDDIERFYELISSDIQTFYKEVKNDKNVIIHAHPLRNNMEPTPLGYVDGVESMNMHPKHHAKPSLIFKFAKENDLLVTGGSDFHHLHHEALCLMRTEKEMKNSFYIADAIKSKNTVYDCSGHIIIPYIY